MKERNAKLVRPLIQAVLFLSVLVLFSAKAWAGLNDGLIAWLKLDDGSGISATDASGNANAGALQDFPVDNSGWVSGQVKGGLKFDGATGTVILSPELLKTVTLHGNYSISLWFFDMNPGAGATLINIGNSATDMNGIGIHSSGTLQGGSFDGSVWSGRTKYLTVSDFNKWNHVVLINNAGNFSFYFDGIAVTGAGNYGYFLGSTKAASLSSPLKFKGIMDDVRIYNRPLSPSEAVGLYQYGLTGYNPPAVVTGIDQAISLPASATLSGSVSVDAGLSAVTHWVMLAGPDAGSVIFQNANAIATTASFSVAGTYTLQLSVNDGKSTSTANVTINVYPQGVTPPSPVNFSNISPLGERPAWVYYDTIRFSTDVDAQCKISKDEQTSFANITDVAASTLGTEHSFPVTGLVSGQSYKYYAYCKDLTGKQNPAFPITFMIASDTTFPEVMNLAPTYVYFDTAVIQWNTSKPTETLVEYGLTTQLGQQTWSDKSLAIPHGVTLTGLNPGTVYYYRVTCKDKSGNNVTSAIQKFSTLSRSYAREFFVSRNGDAANAGTIDSPVATLEQALRLVRTWRAGNPGCNAPVMVWLRGGEYLRNNVFALGSGDSGTTGCPTIFSGYQNENAVITGGLDLDSSKFTKIVDSSILARLSVSARENVYQFSLKDNGIEDYGDLKGVAAGNLSPMELIVNGKPMALSRYPNRDNLHVTSVAFSGTNPVLGYTPDPRPSAWADTSDIWVHGRFKFDWRDYHQHVSSFDLPNSRMTLDSSNGNANEGYAAYDKNIAGWFYFENILEELDAPGEYYIDRGKGILYVWPAADLSQSRVQVTMAKDNFVKTYSVSNIIFQNLTFENNRNTAFYLTRTSDFALVNAIIRNIGASAFITTGGDPNSRVGVYHSHIYDIGSSGISLYTVTPDILSSGRNFALNNKVHRTGRWDVINYGGFPIAAFGANPYVSHNDVHDQESAGILFYSTTNGIMEYNEVHDVMQLANDYGGLYIAGSMMSRGNIAKFNYLHDITGVPDNPSAEGIYFDEATPGCIAYGNVMSSIAPERFTSGREGGAFMIGGGRNVILDNNILVNSQVGIHLGIWSDLAKKKSEITAAGYSAPNSTFFPEGTEILAATLTLVPEGTVIRRNILYEAAPLYQNANNQKWEPYLDMRDNMVGIDPHFVDVSKNNFQLKDDSPAYVMGFQKIPFEDIGLMDKTSPVFYEAADLIGDVSGNLQVTLYDAAMTLKESSLHGLTDAQLMRADIDHDGKVTAQDARAIANKALGLRK
ncbi:MAG: right-handed parallel beta-helix repeat-containing protein [Candidatus Omnitrophica bacterium]|nr:right-handed parallel beta-helix repeat-containing protein [Candidatus Omnitrophota bacterium]